MKEALQSLLDSLNIPNGWSADLIAMVEAGKPSSYFLELASSDSQTRFRVACLRVWEFLVAHESSAAKREAAEAAAAQAEVDAHIAAGEYRCSCGCGCNKWHSEPFSGSCRLCQQGCCGDDDTTERVYRCECDCGCKDKFFGASDELQCPSCRFGDCDDE